MPEAVPSPSPETPATAGAAAPPAGPTVAELQAQLAEQKDRYLRLLAEMDNMRKRFQREMGEVRQVAKAATIEEFLTVWDHFQMAMTSIGGATDLEVLKQGMQMIAGDFDRCFESLGVDKLKTVGQPFDPTQHEAIATEASPTVPEHHVLREWKAGYRLGERLLRPAAVIVSSGPPPPVAAPEPGGAAADAGEGGAARAG